MKNPQGREARKPKKSKVKTKPQHVEGAVSQPFVITKGKADPGANRP